MKTPTAILTFDARSGILSGRIDPEQPPFYLHGESGGGRGHAAVTAQQTRDYRLDQSKSLLSRLSTTQETKDRDGRYVIRGGTIPEGTYLCAYLALHHGFHGPVIQLRQTASAMVIRSPFASMPIVHSRAGFFIHGVGPKGSDGCIVVTRTKERDRLFEGIRTHQVALKVIHVAGYLLPAENFAGITA